MTTRNFSREELTSYVSGQAAPKLEAEIEKAAELDPGLADRILTLDPWTRTVREAVGAIPITQGAERAAQAFARAVERTSEGVKTSADTSRPVSWSSLASAFLAGAIASWALMQFGTSETPDLPDPPSPIQQQPAPPTKPPGRTENVPVAANSAKPEPTWRDAVAGYVRLMTPETFTSAPQSQEQAIAALASAQKSVGVDVATLVTRVPDLTFQRAEVLTLNGRPLVQLAFLDKQQNVVAICVLSRKAKPETLPPDTLSSLKPETVSGHSIVSWDYNTHGFLVISKDKPESVLEIAKQVARPI
jgi:anti-sigma factor RsiW